MQPPGAALVLASTVRSPVSIFQPRPHRNAGTYEDDPWTFTDVSATTATRVGRSIAASIRPILDISAVTETKVYDGGTTSSGIPTVSGLQGKHRQRYRQDPGVRLPRTSSAPTAARSPVTAYTVNDGNSGNNYAVATHSALGDDSRPAISTFSAVTETKVYDGGTTSSGIPTVSGLQGSTDSVYRQDPGVRLQERPRHQTAARSP
jgi:hypothetical protein